MFKPSEKNSQDSEIETIIGPSVKVEGDFVGEGNVIVEGFVSGALKTNKNLKVGEKAKILANIKATNALIAGEVNGNINIEGTLELTATAKVNGDIKAKIMVIAAGAIFNGKCEMGVNGENAKGKKDKVEPPVSVKTGKE
ncbi:MAG: polymer-forming cytoskeletal protein [bacterium]